MYHQYDIGSQIKNVTGVAPQAAAAGTINGPAIDRRGLNSCVLFVTAGAATGAPTALTLDSKLQDSADGSTGWADLSGAAITQIVAASTDKQVDVNLKGAKAYIRVVQTTGFTGGTTPTLNQGATVTLGGPVVAAV
jgi:hypothetical protein